MALISESDLNELRRFQEALMETTCKVERFGTRTFDDMTGDMAAGTAVSLYEGPCRVSSTSGPSIVTAGDEAVAFQMTNIYIPSTSSQPQRDDVVTILTAADPKLVGTTFTIIDTPRTQYLTARKLICTGAQKSSNWEGA